MKPVAIFRFSRTEGPGYFASFLNKRGIPYTLFKLDDGAVVPDDISPYSGFGLMGGPMSANDVLPWNPPLLDLIRKAVRAEQPCIGHCLGGQLMARALGGKVSANPVKEIGWHTVSVEPNAAARSWLPGLDKFVTFQWHGETFTIPPGATRILSSAHCENQAYALGKHLGLQCHVEMTREMIDVWCDDGAPEIAREVSEHRAVAVQQPESIKAAAGERLPVLSDVAGRLYEKWAEGLAR